MTAQSARAARAIELEETRQRAGLSVEQLAGRIVDRWDALQRNGRRTTWDRSVAKAARQIAYLEKASEGAYERSEAWWQAPEEQRGARPRVQLSMWREAMAAAHHANPAEATAEVLLLDVLWQADNRRKIEQRVRESTRERGHDVATLVWNAAEDPEFLDHALVEELRAVPPRHADYLLRAALIELAREIRVTFPDRPSRELRSFA
ncbi:hypothetical protein AB0230_06955 [Microbacterium sp. NPDC089190]|uniref:hypothetical protein n=1 Tax=Microbacterium sp. NPDC089190 TaxID=3155063 RepID=UPI00344EE0FA